MAAFWQGEGQQRVVPRHPPAGDERRLYTQYLTFIAG